MRSASFALAYARTILAVALTEEELGRFRRIVFFQRARASSPEPGLTWYWWTAKSIPMAFARWLVSNHERTFGLRALGPWSYLRVPSLFFLQNYSAKRALRIFPYKSQTMRVNQKGKGGSSSIPSTSQVQPGLLPEVSGDEWDNPIISRGDTPNWSQARGMTPDEVEPLPATWSHSPPPFNDGVEFEGYLTD